MAYKEMPFMTYIITTLVLYFGQVIASLVISDIGLIFEFVSAIAISSIAFIFPACFYLMAEAKFATELQKMEMKKKWMRCKAIFFLIFGIIAFVF